MQPPAPNDNEIRLGGCGQERGGGGAFITLELDLLEFLERPESGVAGRHDKEARRVPVGEITRDAQRSAGTARSVVADHDRAWEVIA